MTRRSAPIASWGKPWRISSDFARGMGAAPRLRNSSADGTHGASTGPPQPPQFLLAKAISPTPLSRPAAVPAETARRTRPQPDDDDERVRLVADGAASLAGFCLARAAGGSVSRNALALPRFAGSACWGGATAGTGAAAGAGAVAGAAGGTAASSLARWARARSA